MNRTTEKLNASKLAEYPPYDILAFPPNIMANPDAFTEAPASLLAAPDKNNQKINPRAAAQIVQILKIFDFFIYINPP